MRCPPECYQLQQALAVHLPQLRPAERRGLALWVYGTILAHSACQHAVLAALLLLGSWHSLRQTLREWLCDGAERAAPGHTPLDVTACFALLLRWLLAGGRANSWPWPSMLPANAPRRSPWSSASSTGVAPSRSRGTCCRPTRSAPGRPTRFEVAPGVPRSLPRRPARAGPDRTSWGRTGRPGAVVEPAGGERR